MNKKQVALNVVINVIAFTIGIGITFFLTPYIIENLGVEAYGFFHLANTFFSYATIITIAVNSMAGRFISISYHRGDLKKAQGYFNTVLVADIIIALALLVVSVFVVVFLDKLINIPLHLVRDVKVMFMLIFSSSFLVIALFAFNTSTFVKNRIDIIAYVNILKSIIRGGVLLMLFALFNPNLIYVGIASFAILVFEAIAYVTVKKKILPDIQVSLKSYDKTLLSDLVKSGRWNVINNLNGILVLGLDLLFANIFLGATAAGVLALAKTIPAYSVQLIDLIKNSFIPSLTKGYAKDEESLMKNLKTSFIALVVVGSIVFGGILAVGDIFYGLWIPSENNIQLQILTALIILGDLVYFGVITIQAVFQITNRLRKRSLVNFGVSLLSVIVVITLLKTTSLGLYVIAGVTSVLLTIIRLTFIYPLAAKIIKQKWYAFYPAVGKSLLCLGIVVAIGYGLRSIWNINSWGKLALSVLIIACLSATINFFIMTKRENRQNIYSKAKSIIRTKSS